MSLITTIIDGIAPNPSSGLGGANEGHIQGFQDDIINGIAGGVADKTGGQCLVTQNSPLGMSVLVADGVVYIPNADYIANLATATKFYRVVIKDEDPVTIPSNTSGDTCQHGLDVVIDKDTVPNEYGSNVATLVVTLGTPGAGAPAVPDNGYRLAEVEVVNGATQIATASITDTRTQISINDVVISTNIVTKTGTQTLTNKTLTSPKVGTAILDANGNEVIKTPATTSAVNEITVTNAATGNAVQISATGGDDNIGLTVASKGTGVIKLKSGSSTTNGHTVPNIADDTVALLAASQTLSNKGISSFIAPNTVASGGTVTTNSTTELTCIETTITNPPIAGQIFIVANFGMNSASVAGDYFIYKVYFGTTPTLITTNTQTVYTTSGGGRHVVTMSAVAAVAASGTQKIKMTVTRGGGTGTIASQSGETYVSWIIVPGAGTTA